jgi:hypothetical protein
MQKQPGLVSVLVPISLGDLKNEDAIRVADFLAPFPSMLFAPHSASILGWEIYPRVIFRMSST